MGTRCPTSDKRVIIYSNNHVWKLLEYTIIRITWLKFCPVMISVYTFTKNLVLRPSNYIVILISNKPSQKPSSFYWIKYKVLNYTDQLCTSPTEVGTEFVTQIINFRRIPEFRLGMKALSGIDIQRISTVKS